MKYFSIDRIRQCSRHLENFHSGWVIVPFVLAANGVNKKTFTSLTTDPFLDKYFSGDLIGLAGSSGGNALRPRFKEIVQTFRHTGRAADFVINQPTKLWANGYSSRGYREMTIRGELEFDGTSSCRLTDSFRPAFEANLPDTFRFEELLVWLYAFYGIPDDVSDWDALSIGSPAGWIAVRNGGGPPRNSAGGCAHEHVCNSGDCVDSRGGRACRRCRLPVGLAGRSRRTAESTPRCGIGYCSGRYTMSDHDIFLLKVFVLLPPPLVALTGSVGAWCPAQGRA